MSERRQKSIDRKIYKPSDIRKIMAVGTLTLLAWAGGAFGGDKDATPPKTADEAITCMPVGGHEVTVQPGQGVDALTLQIEGSGVGESDPCWGEAHNEVVKATGKIPQAGSRVIIPDQMVEVRK